MNACTFCGQLCYGDNLICEECYADRERKLIEGFDVTDPDEDAPDGVEVDGFERHGMRWEPAARASQPEGRR